MRVTRRVVMGSMGGVLIGANAKRFAAAEEPIARAVANGKLRAAVLRVEAGGELYEKAFGSARISTPFLIASITKPMTVAAVMTLVDEGKLRLDEPARVHLKALDGRITLRHMLSHASGLPDMLPENIAMRKRQAPLREFAEKAETTPLLFAPGSRVSYQSMGILLAATIAEKVSGRPFPQLLDERLFRPLGMKDTVLGLGRYRIEDTAQSQAEFADPVGGTPETKSWDWNSVYWRNLAAPWGGAHSTAADIAQFLRYFLRLDGGPLSKASARAMITNQHAGLNQPYGLGWALQPKPFGHGGSTGTLCWADAAKDATFVLLTTLPARVSQRTILDPVSKLVRESL